MPAPESFPEYPSVSNRNAIDFFSRIKSKDTVRYHAFLKKGHTLKTVEPLLEKLSMLDLSKLSEQQRRVVVVEIKSHLDHFAPDDDPEEAWLNHRVKLLEYWHQLVKLRLADVQANAEPPAAPIKLEPFLTRVDEAPEPLHDNSDDDEHLEHRSEIASEEEVAHGHRSIGEQADAYVPLPRAPGQEDWVDVILTEAGIIRGMQLPAGITVTVSPEDGEHIVEKFKGKILTPNRSADDPPL